MSANISASAWLSAPAFFSRVADRREDLRAVPPRDVGGVVGAVVGHDHHLLRRPRLPPQRLQRRPDREGSRRGPAPARSGASGFARASVACGSGSLLGGKLRLVDQPDRCRAQRSQHDAAQPAHLRRQRSRNAAGRGPAPASPRPRAGRPDPRRRWPSPRRRPGSARRTERCRRRRAEADRRCPSGSSRNASHAATAHQHQCEPDQRNCEKAQPSHSPTTRKLINHRHRRTVSRPPRTASMSWHTAVARAITRPAGRPRADAPFRRRRVRDRMASPNLGAARLVRPSSESAGRGRRSSTTTRVSCGRLDSRPTPPSDKQRERRSSLRLIRESESPSLASPASRARVRSDGERVWLRCVRDEKRK